MEAKVSWSSGASAPCSRVLLFYSPWIGNPADEEHLNDRRLPGRHHRLQVDSDYSPILQDRRTSSTLKSRLAWYDNRQDLVRERRRRSSL